MAAPPTPDKESCSYANASSQEIFFSFNQNFDQTISYYKTWAQSYEKDVEAVGYMGPALAAEYFANLGLPTNVKILDVACGTGLCAMILRDKFGYSNVDGLDACDEMLAIAAEREVYNKQICSKIGDGSVMPIDDNSYDAVTMAGGLGTGHIMLDAFEDIIRVTKLGGYVVITMRDNYRQTSIECKDLDKIFAGYEHKGLWKKVSETITKNYIANYDGLVLVYQVNKDTIQC